MNHIAYLTTEYPHPDLPSAGGVGSFVKLMANSLIKQNWEVTVFLALRDIDKIWFDGTIRIVEIKKQAPSLLSPFKDRRTISKVIRKHIKKDNIQLVEAADWEGFHAFCNFKIPIITRIHGSVTYFNYLQKSAQSRVITFFEKRALKKSKQIVAVSRYSGELTEKLFELPKFKFEVVYNGVDVQQFQPSNQGQEINNSDLLYFGTLVRKKGVFELVIIFNELVKINPKARLVFVGKDTVDGVTKKSTWESVKQLLSQEALINTTYKGVVSYQDMGSIIKKARVCVFPSFAEAFPISWLEAMSMSKPIVASSIGWASEAIVSGESGILVHPENHEDYAKKINRLLLDPALASSLGKNARKRVIDKFDQQDIVQQNIAVYKKVIGNE